MALDWIMSCWHKVKYTQGDKPCTSLRKPAKKRANIRVVITANPAACSSLKQHRLIKLTAATAAAAEVIHPSAFVVDKSGV